MLKPLEEAEFVEHPHSLADQIEDANWWRRLTDKPLFRAGAIRLRQVVAERDVALYKVESLEGALAKATQNLDDARQEAKSIYKRIELILGEMDKSPKTIPAAIVLSPYQLQLLTVWGNFHAGTRGQNAEGAKVSKLFGLPIHTAKGVFGPVVLTEEGFAGFSRMAPELNIKAV